MCKHYMGMCAHVQVLMHELKNSTCQIELPARVAKGVDSIVQDFKETTSQ